MTGKEKTLAFIEERIKWNEDMLQRDPKPSDIGRIEEAKCIRRFIDSLQEEPVSEDLEEAAKNHAAERFRVTRDRELAEKCKWSFKAGANWKRDQIAKENMLLPFKEYNNLMESINKRKKEGYETGYKQGLVDSKSEQKPTLDKLPFGAKDSELIEKTISIPKGCYVIIKDNKIIIRKEKFI